jgi:hypothetical protein
MCMYARHNVPMQRNGQCQAYFHISPVMLHRELHSGAMLRHRYQVSAVSGFAIDIQEKKIVQHIFVHKTIYFNKNANSRHKQGRWVSQAGREAARQAGRQPTSQTGSQTDREPDRQGARQTGRQADKAGRLARQAG